MTYPGDCYEVEHAGEEPWHPMLVLLGLFIAGALVLREVRARARRRGRTA